MLCDCLLLQNGLVGFLSLRAHQHPWGRDTPHVTGEEAEAQVTIMAGATQLICQGRGRLLRWVPLTPSHLLEPSTDGCHGSHTQSTQNKGFQVLRISRCH